MSIDFTTAIWVHFEKPLLIESKSQLNMRSHDILLINLVCFFTRSFQIQLERALENE